MWKIGKKCKILFLNFQNSASLACFSVLLVLINIMKEIKAFMYPWRLGTKLLYTCWALTNFTNVTSKPRNPKINQKIMTSKCTYIRFGNWGKFIKLVFEETWFLYWFLGLGMEITSMWGSFKVCLWLNC